MCFSALELVVIVQAEQIIRAIIHRDRVVAVPRNRNPNRELAIASFGTVTAAVCGV